MYAWAKIRLSYLKAKDFANSTRFVASQMDGAFLYDYAGHWMIECFGSFDPKIFIERIYAFQAEQCPTNVF